MLLPRDHSREKGQSMVLVALSVVAFVAMLALVLDGGTAYAIRRKAQNAADAGALAGAQYLCARLTEADVAVNAANTANDYAVTRNEATTSVSSVNITNRTVTVTTAIRQDSFFAGLIGRQVYTPTSMAAARCFPAGGRGVMPIAWSCRPPIIGVTDPTKDCSMWIGPSYKYLIMDSKNVNEDFYCQDPPNSGQPPNALDCDFNNDGVDEFLGGNDRSWLDLNGGPANATEMRRWINGSVATPELFPHVWYPDRTGVGNSIFDETEVFVGEDVLVPIFNKYCDGDPQTKPDCVWDAGDNIVIGSGATFYYHVIGFALFHVTCVQAAGQPLNEDGSHQCPVHDAAVEVFKDDSPPTFKDSTKSIEGYWREGLVSGHGTGDWDYPYTGAYVVRLVR